MSSNQEVVVISIGSKLHPFLSSMIESGDIAVTYITNTVCDFSIYHADPSKILDYHLEFINIIGHKAKRSMESVSVFETLGQFFEFYNPLHLSTLNYLFSKYATNVKQQTKNLTEVWRNIAKSIFDDDFIYPLFDEIRQIHVKEGDIEIPVRQLLLKYERLLEDKKNGKISDEVLKNITGIIDLEEINKLKINPTVSKKIEQASGVIIVPSDLISLFLVFQSSSFRETLKKTSGEIVIISPFLADQENFELEKNILQKSNFEPTLSNFVTLIGNVVDTIIIDKKDSSQVSKLREAGITVIVDELKEERLRAPEFLELVLRSIEIEPELVYKEPIELKEGFGEKIVNLFSSRFSEDSSTTEKEELTSESKIIDTADISDADISETDISEETEKITSEQSSPTEKQSAVDKEFAEKQTSTAKMNHVDDLSTFTDLMEHNESDIVEQFEMEVEDTSQKLEKRESILLDSSVSPEKIPSTKSEEKQVEFFLPGIDEIEKAELQDFNSFEADESIINAYIDRAMLSNDIGLEIAFSDLLSLQNNEILVDKIYKILMKRLTKTLEYSAESKLTDIITYLAAHKPSYYIEKFKELLEETIQSEYYEEFIELSEKAALIIGKSFPVGEEVVKNFIVKYIDSEDFYIEEKLRLIIRDFFPSSMKTRKAISKTLLTILYNELKKEEKNQTKIKRLLSIISMLDAHVLGLEFIQIFKVEDFEMFTPLLTKDLFTKGFQQVFFDIMKAFQETNIEQLRIALHGLKLPREVQSLLIKESYKRSLSKVGSISLDIFAEQSGLTPEKAEKLVYDMIMKGEIKAKIELVNERLYIVQEKKEVEEEKKQKETTEKVVIQPEQVVDSEQEIKAVTVSNDAVSEVKTVENEQPEIQVPPQPEIQVPPQPEIQVPPQPEIQVAPETEEKSEKQLDVISVLGKRAQPIIDAGYDTIEKIAKASINELVKIKGIGEKTALSIVNKAKEKIGS